MSSFQEIKRDVLSQEQINQYKTQGYLVIENVLTEEQCDQVLTSIVNFANKVAFEIEGEKPHLDPQDFSSFSILSDEKIRQQKMNNPNAIYLNSNTRSPKIPKSTGMLNGFFIPEVQVLCMSNPFVYNVFRQIFEQDELVLLPERVGIKVPGATDMKEHLDIDLLEPFREKPQDFETTSKVSKSVFNSELWKSIHGSPPHFNDRIQGFINILVDENMNPRDSGTLSLVTHWCLYWELLQQIFHYETGLADYRMDKQVILPNFYNHNIELNPLNRYLQFYTDLQENRANINPDKPYRKGSIEAHAIFVYKTLKIKVPSTFHPLERVCIPGKRGSLIIWSGAPHQNLRNNSKVPRVVTYVDFRKLPKDPKELEEYYYSNEFRVRQESIMGLKGLQSNSKSNQIEVDVAKRFYSKPGSYPGPYTLNQTYSTCLCSPLYKALLGFDKNTGQTFTWDMFKKGEL